MEQQQWCVLAAARPVAPRSFHRAVDALLSRPAQVLNPASFCREDSCLIDVCKDVSVPVVEVHVTNPASRGASSLLAPLCRNLVYGFGVYG